MYVLKENVTSPASRNQKGAVLLVSMMILLILTLITLVSMKGAATQERIAGSTRSLDLSLQAAEAATRAVEGMLDSNSIDSITGMPNPRPASGWYNYADDQSVLSGMQRPTPKPADWGSTVATYDIASDQIPDPRVYGNDPKYFVEAMPPVPDPGGDLEAGGTVPGITMYKITSVGYSAASPDGVKAPPFSVIIQSTFRR